MSTKMYIAGPMTGVPQFNVPAFDALAKKLRDAGNIVISPAELDSAECRAELLASPDGQYEFGGAITQDGSTWADFLARDVKLIADEIDEIVVLPNWWKSRGARLEVFVGLLCKKRIYEWNERNPQYPLKRLTVLAMLNDIKNGFMGVTR